MVVVFALLAALSNAVNEATQHVASTAAPRRSSGWRLVLYLFRNPLWLFGWVALVAAFVFQALALHDGLISVVQPLLATELVFMLVLRRFWTFIKATTDTLTRFGVAGMFTHWPVYALAAGGVAALFLEQAALHVGPLRISQPFLVIIDPIVSIALSVWLFEESFTSDAAVLAVAAVALAMMCAGVVLLTQTAPATMKADTQTGKERRWAAGAAGTG